MSVKDFIDNSQKSLRRKVKVKEKTTEDLFCDFAKTMNCLAVKLILLRLRGWPDRTVLCPGGRVVFFEFKRTETETRTPQQDKWKGVIERYGFHYVTVWDLEEAKSTLIDFLNDNIL